MVEGRPQFDDGEAYERFMGRWSRSVGAIFLAWLAAPKDAHWLDVGCGTGAFTELILDSCSPATVMAADPALAQIDHARTQPIAQRADFRVADAQNLPFPEDQFDVVASALVINFIPDRPRALGEMRRVARPGGLVGGYVWDFDGIHEPYAPIRHALNRIGMDPPPTAGTEDSTPAALRSLFERAGYEDVATRTIDVTRTFSDFDDLWRANTPIFHHIGKAVAALSETDRVRTIEAVRSALPTSSDGSITYSARANAIKARVPA